MEFPVTATVVPHTVSDPYGIDLRPVIGCRLTRLRIMCN